MGYVGFFVAQCHGTDETFHFYWFSCKAFADKGSFSEHALPRLALALARLDNLEHLVLCDTPDFGQGHGILCSLVFAFLLDCARESLGVLLALAVEEVCRERTVGDSRGVCLLDVALVVGLEGLFELDLFGVAFGVEELGLDAECLLCECGGLVDLSGLTLAPGKRM